MIPAEGAWEPDGSRECGGESGIRTHDKVAPIPVFEFDAGRWSMYPYGANAAYCESFIRRRKRDAGTVWKRIYS